MKRVTHAAAQRGRSATRAPADRLRRVGKPALPGPTGPARFLQKDIGPLPFWLGVAAAVVLRLAIAASQRVFLMPEASSLDDMLMFRAAVSALEGGWMGDYGAFTIAKNMGFALWLVLVHKIGVPLLVANAGLWLLCCGFAAWAVRPMLPGRLVRLLLFAFLALQPFTYSQYTMRAYRDAIFPAFCLLVFAGAFGVVVRLAYFRAEKGRLRGALLCGLGSGVGLAGVCLLREDGAVVLAYAVVALVLAVVYTVFRKGYTRKLLGLLSLTLPFGVLGAALLTFSAANYATYGIFMVNDLSGGSFPRAYGAMAAVSRAESDFTLKVPVTRAALDKLYEASPTLARLEPYLAEGTPAFNGYNNGEGEFGGSFYYALRAATDSAGIREDTARPPAVNIQAFWRQVADEIKAAVADGRLESARAGGTVVPLWDGALFAPAAAETGRGFMAVMTFAECWPQPAESMGDPELVDEVAAWMHSPVQRGYMEGTDQPYYNWFQRLFFALAQALTWVYRVLIWPLLAAGLWGLGRALVRGVKDSIRERRFSGGLMVAVAVLGLLVSFIARLVVAGYMEVASFGIGTFPMYLAGGVPALLLFVFAGTAYVLRGWGRAGGEAPAAPAAKGGTLPPAAPAWKKGRAPLPPETEGEPAR